MKRVIMSIALIACLATAAAIYAGDGFHMKCQPKPAKDPKAGNSSEHSVKCQPTQKDTKTDKPSKPCGYESYVSFGGGMFYDQLTGYCRSCKKFVYLSWTGANIPAQMKQQIKFKAPPKPLGEVWDARTGKFMAIYACPKCNGPFLEIKKIDDLKHCPVCNNSHFAIDNSKPRIAID
jgi:hypothetical protein